MPSRSPLARARSVASRSREHLRRRFPRLEPALSGDGFQYIAPGRFKGWYAPATFEPLTVAWLKTTLKTGMTFVDVGAHIGYVSLLGSRLVGSTGTVVAVEPGRESLRYLRRNIELNNARNISVHGCAAGAERAVRHLHTNESTDSFGFYDHPLTPTHGLVDVQQIALDDVLQRADVVKIDVEGAELEVLQGAERLLATCRPRLLLELMPACMRAAGREPADLVRWIQQRDYEIEAVLADVDRATRDVGEVLEADTAGTLPLNWYANIVASPV